MDLSEDNSKSDWRAHWKGKGLVILSGPSGVGKTTVERHLLSNKRLPIARSVSATTRKPRGTESQGVDYWFLTAADFATKREAGEFLECFEVFGRGTWYGTLKSEVFSKISDGFYVLLNIDVQGGRKVIMEYPEALGFFLLPPNREELERRLRGRGTDSEEAIAARLRMAETEIAAAGAYHFQLVVDNNVGQITEQIVQAIEAADGTGCHGETGSQR